jgi:hypothetical protein
MTSLPEQDQADRLLQRIRARVAELRRLEQARADRNELRRRRREITELQWQLARFISHPPVAANSPRKALLRHLAAHPGLIVALPASFIVIVVVVPK